MLAPVLEAEPDSAPVEPASTPEHGHRNAGMGEEEAMSAAVAASTEPAPDVVVLGEYQVTAATANQPDERLAAALETHNLTTHFDKFQARPPAVGRGHVSLLTILRTRGTPNFVQTYVIHHCITKFSTVLES
jgi:hypothetical protein